MVPEIQNTAASDMGKPVILVVDDDPNNLAVVRDCLVEFKYTVLVAEDGESAIQRADYVRPDLILLDIMMPGIDGYETCRRLKAIQTTKEIPVIFMTALAETGHKVKGLEAGAVDYITKPFQREELQARIAVHLYNRELAKRLQEAKELLETRVEKRTVELARTNTKLQAEISERRQAEKQLASLNQRLEGLVEQRTEQLNCRNAELVASEERYRNLVESMQEGILAVDRDGRLTYVNRQMSNMLQMAPDMLIGRECADLLEAKDREAFETNLKSANGQFALKFEVNFIRSDGHIVSTLVTPTTLYDSEERSRGYFAVVTDISHLKQLQTRLLHAQKLESIGQLAAGIAHEINTPTQYVVNNARFLDDAFKELVEVLAAYESLFYALKHGLPPSTAMEEVETSRENHQLVALSKEISGAFHDTFEGLERISNIVRSVKQFAHPGQDATASADLNDAIRNTITVSTNEWKYVANVETYLDPALPLVPCNISAINQVILNLIVNAADAIADQQIVSGVAGKGTITLKTTNLGEFVEIRVTDTGPGIPESIRNRIFDPFFTTKSVGKGSGQGLAIARTIVTETHHGLIDFETGIGSGTTFIVRLPMQNKNKQHFEDDLERY